MFSAGLGRAAVSANGEITSFIMKLLFCNVDRMPSSRYFNWDNGPDVTEKIYLWCTDLCIWYRANGLTIKVQMIQIIHKDFQFNGGSKTDYSAIYV